MGPRSFAPPVATLSRRAFSSLAAGSSYGTVALYAEVSPDSKPSVSGSFETGGIRRTHDRTSLVPGQAPRCAGRYDGTGHGAMAEIERRSL